MRRYVTLSILALASATQVHAAGLLIPEEKKVPPLAMLNHHVKVTIDDQVATTRVEQTFRNHTDRQLEATYIFPVPKGASVTKFSMWVGSNEVKGELVEAKKAREIYTKIVRRTQDPGLLEYMGHNLLKLRVFPIPAKSDQKISFTYTSVVPRDNGLISYTYPLKTDGRAIQTLDKFSVNVVLKSQHPIQNIYSPTHGVTTTRKNERHAHITFAKGQALLDRNFQLYYTAGKKDVGLTTITHRPVPGNPGHFLLLVSPRAELSKEQQVPRDIVFVVDTSGSMRNKRIAQAQEALNYCLGNLNKQDRFAIISFATTVNKYSERWLPASENNTVPAQKWVKRLEATGGTAINDALSAAQSMRSKDSTRTFTIVFFTDGRPTIGETNVDRILQNVAKRNSNTTRFFAFGVGNDVNATMLDQLAEQSRGVSTYARESEAIKTKVASLYNKISHPVLTNLELRVGDGVQISEVYPPKLPDLFHGSQLVVLGRYNGKGQVAIKLKGSVGKADKEFVYEMTYPDKTNDDKAFVEDLWARRKVGYLLDQIRLNGEKKELVQEVVFLAKRYGITTPYTSYLIVPDAPTPVVRAERKTNTSGGAPDVAFRLKRGRPGGSFGGNVPSPTPGFSPPGRGFGGGGFSGGFNGNPAQPTGTKRGSKGTTPTPTAPVPVTSFLKKIQSAPGDGAKSRAKIANDILNNFDAQKDAKGKSKGDDKNSGKYSTHYARALQEAQRRWRANNKANTYLRRGYKEGVQSGRLGVDLSLESNNLRTQCQIVTNNAVRNVQSRNCLEIGGVWVDQGYHAKMKTVVIKAMSNAYFRILERHPRVKEVYQLGNHLVWVTPSGTALVIDTSTGQEKMSDSAIDALFTMKK